MDNITNHPVTFITAANYIEDLSYTIPSNIYNAIICKGLTTDVYLPVVEENNDGTLLIIKNAGFNNITVRTQNLNQIKFNNNPLALTFNLDVNYNIILTSLQPLGIWYIININNIDIIEDPLNSKYLFVNTIDKKDNADIVLASDIKAVDIMFNNGTQLNSVAQVTNGVNTTVINNNISTGTIQTKNITMDNTILNGLNGTITANGMNNGITILNNSGLVTTNAANVKDNANVTQISLASTGVITAKSLVAGLINADGNTNTINAYNYEAVNNSNITTIALDELTATVNAITATVRNNAGTTGIIADPNYIDGASNNVPSVNWGNRIRLYGNDTYMVTIGNPTTNSYISGTYNMIIGNNSGQQANNGTINTIVGNNSCNGATTRSHIVAIGNNIANNVSGNYVTVIGNNIGYTSMSNNTIAFNGTNNLYPTYPNVASSFTVFPVNDRSGGLTNSLIYDAGEVCVGTATSDIRIKTNIEDLNDTECLNIVKNIQPKKYNYIDNHISEKVYGFIAQQVEENLPYAVNTYTDFIPNIYQELNYEIIEETEIVPNVYDYLLYLPILSEVNDILRFIYDENPHEALVLEKLTDKIKVSVTHIKKLSGTIFVYGKKVDDFKSLLKESLYPVLWSAIQKIQLQNMEMMTKL